MKNGKFGSIKRGRDFGLKTGGTNDSLSHWTKEDADEMFESIFGEPLRTSAFTKPEPVKADPVQLGLFEGGRS